MQMNSRRDSTKPKAELVSLLLGKRMPGIEASRLGTVATVLSLLEDLDPHLSTAALRGFDEARFPPDGELVLRLYRSCPERLKIDLANSAIVHRLEPHFFEPIFDDACRRRMTPVQRRELLFNMYLHLASHLSRVPRYRKAILESMRSPQREVAMHGLLLAGYLGDLSRQDLAFIQRRMSSRAFYFRMNALNAICHLLKRPHALRPEVLAFCTSEPVIAKARALYQGDEDKHVRLCAKHLLRAHRDLPGLLRRSPQETEVAPW